MGLKAATLYRVPSLSQFWKQFTIVTGNKEVKESEYLAGYIATIGPSESRHVKLKTGLI